MATNRIVSAPADIKNYPDNQIVFRSVTLPRGHPQYVQGGKVVEVMWGDVHESDGATLKHPAESVSFGQTEGGWDKKSELRMG